jgi:hypothetical protein
MTALAVLGVTLHNYRGGTRQDARLPRMVRPGGFGPQQQGGASRLRETGADENPLAGRLRATHSGEDRIGRVNTVNAQQESGGGPAGDPRMRRERNGCLLFAPPCGLDDFDFTSAVKFS